MKPIDTDDWLATMRSAWKAGIDRDEREQCAASTRRLVRGTERVESARQPLREVLPLAVCVGACVLGGVALHHAATAPVTNEIRADETQETPPAELPPAEPAPSSPVPIATVSAAAPTSSARSAPVAPPKTKSQPEALPQLPPPGPSTSPPVRPPGRRERLRQILRVHGHRHPPKKHDREL